MPTIGNVVLMCLETSRDRVECGLGAVDLFAFRKTPWRKIQLFSHSTALHCRCRRFAPYIYKSCRGEFIRPVGQYRSSWGE